LARVSVLVHGGQHWARLVPLHTAKVETTSIHACPPEVLRQAGVRLLVTKALRVAQDQGQWVETCSDGSNQRSGQIVLAAEADCRNFWPTEPEVLRVVAARF
jgi:hypothetical protein